MCSASLPFAESDSVLLFGPMPQLFRLNFEPQRHDKALHSWNEAGIPSYGLGHAGRRALSRAGPCYLALGGCGRMEDPKNTRQSETEEITNMKGNG
jgi:hypothetical protein